MTSQSLACEVEADVSWATAVPNARMFVVIIRMEITAHSVHTLWWFRCAKQKVTKRNSEKEKVEF